MTLRHYVPPPAPTIGGFSTDFLADLGDLDAALGLEAMGSLADALGQAQGALDAIDKLKDFVEDAAAFVEGAMGIQALLDAAGKVISASET